MQEYLRRGPLEVEGYSEHQNDSGGSSNRTVNAVGVVANFYF